jgi:hypothetical protein
MAEEGKSRRSSASSAKGTNGKASASSAKRPARKAPSKKPTSAAKRAPAKSGTAKAASAKSSAKASDASVEPTRSRPPVNIEPIASAKRDPDPNGGGADASAERKEMPPASETPAPSIGPNTVIEHESPDERLSRHEISNTDAMGLEKRRSVVGGSYSPSLARQAALYGIFIAVIAALAIGFIVLANELDQPPETYSDEAPWSQPDAPQRPPAPPE